jgi:hypothetical protein
VFGIAVATLRGQPLGSEYLYPVRVRLVALDQRDRAVASLDTTVTIRHQRRLEPGEFAVGRVELPLPRGRWRYRASLQQGDSSGVVLPRDSVMVADIYSGRLSLSDLALGAPGRAIPWVTDAADTVLLAPSALFRRGSEIRLYYETNGVMRGLRYRHEITVLRPDRRDSRSGSPLVALSFEEEAPDSVMRSRRSVRLDRLKEGSYVVEVKVTAPDGEVQLRRRDIRLIER